MPRKTRDGEPEGGAPPAGASSAATAKCKPTKTVKAAMGTTGKKKGKGASASEDTHRCFHCQTESTKMMCCSQCHRAWYCGKPCQKKHWKQHKKACVAAVAAFFACFCNGLLLDFHLFILHSLARRA